MKLWKERSEKKDLYKGEKNIYMRPKCDIKKKENKDEIEKEDETGGELRGKWRKGMKKTITVKKIRGK